MIDMIARGMASAARILRSAAAVSSAPGSGSGTLTTPALGGVEIGQLRKGMCGLFRWDDCTAWELSWGFYNGTQVTRPAAGFVSSSTGSRLTLTAAARVSLVSPLGLFQRGRCEAVGARASAFGQSSTSSLGLTAATLFQASVIGLLFADTNAMTRDPAVSRTSATTANSQVGTSAAAVVASRNAGFHLSMRFGAIQLAANPRLIAGMAMMSPTAASEPSAIVMDAAYFGKDSTDTNIQLVTCDNTGTPAKADTGMTLAINKLYESNIWCDQGGNIFGLLVNYDDQTLFYGQATTHLPTAATGLADNCLMSLNGTDTGTAIIMRTGNVFLRSGA